MIIQTHKFPIEHIIIDDMYTEDELKLIWNEIDFLTPKLQSVESIASALDTQGNYKKKANSIFIDKVYRERYVSDILSLNRKLFSDEICEQAKQLHPYFSSLEYVDTDVTLLNHYVDGDYYNRHRDCSVLTAITFFGDGFTGGEFVLSDYNHYIESKNNRTIIIPGSVHHNVEKISMNGGKGRYSMAQFLNFRSQQ